MTVTIPIRTVSEPNTRGHWSGKAKRTREARLAVGLVCAAQLTMVRNHLAAVAGAVSLFTVRLERIAPRSLDSDNLVGSMKGVRDGVADAIGIDDRDPRVTWEYGQSKGKPREYAVKITVRA